MHCNKEWPLLAAARESLCAATKTQHSQKYNKLNKLKKKEVPVGYVVPIIFLFSFFFCLIFMLGVKYLFLTVKTKSESSLLKEFKHCKIMIKNLIFQMYAEKKS